MLLTMFLHLHAPNLRHSHVLVTFCLLCCSLTSFWDDSVTGYQGALKCFPSRVPLKDMG